MFIARQKAFDVPFAVLGISVAVMSGTTAIVRTPSGFLVDRYGARRFLIGGTLLTGGSGTVVGALIGALFLGILKDGLILQGVNANYLLFYSGLAIIIAMTANVFVGRARRGRTGLG